jgi:fatty acid desaturase
MIDEATATEAQAATTPATDPLPRERLAALTQRSNAAGLRRAIAHGAVLGACSFALLRGPLPLSLALVPLQGCLIASLFAPLHEAIHFTVFRTRWLNTALAWPCALALGFVPTGYRLLHYAHHRNSNEWNDPELKGRSIEWPRHLDEYLWRLFSPAFPGLLLKLPMLASLAKGPSETEWQARPYVPAAARRTIVIEARLALLVYAALAALCAWRPAIALATFAPAFIAQVVLAAYLFPEHTGCSPDGSMLERTRTIRTNRLVRFFFWNMPYHAEHHAHPAVPFHALPRLHAELHSRLVHVAKDGYLRFHLRVLRGVARDQDAA